MGTERAATAAVVAYADFSGKPDLDLRRATLNRDGQYTGAHFLLLIPPGHDRVSIAADDVNTGEVVLQGPRTVIARSLTAAGHRVLRKYPEPSLLGPVDVSEVAAGAGCKLLLPDSVGMAAYSLLRERTLREALDNKATELLADGTLTQEQIDMCCSRVYYETAAQEATRIKTAWADHLYPDLPPIRMTLWDRFERWFR